jgi:hypothetical protein
MSYKAIRQWKQNHPEMVREQNSRHYSANKDRINERRRERYQQQKALKQKPYLQEACPQEIVV